MALQQLQRCAECRRDAWQVVFKPPWEERRKIRKTRVKAHGVEGVSSVLRSSTSSEVGNESNGKNSLAQGRKNGFPGSFVAIPGFSSLLRLTRGRRRHELKMETRERVFLSISDFVVRRVKDPMVEIDPNTVNEAIIAEKKAEKNAADPADSTVGPQTIPISLFGYHPPVLPRGVSEVALAVAIVLLLATLLSAAVLALRGKKQKMGTPGRKALEASTLGSADNGGARKEVDGPIGSADLEGSGDLVEAGVMIPSLEAATSSFEGQSQSFQPIPQYSTGLEQSDLALPPSLSSSTNTMDERRPHADSTEKGEAPAVGNNVALSESDEITSTSDEEVVSGNGKMAANNTREDADVVELQKDLSSTESSVEEMPLSDTADSIESSVKEMASDAAGSIESAVEEMAPSHAASSIESSVEEMAPSDTASSLESSAEEMASDVASSIESSVEEMAPADAAGSIESSVKETAPSDAASSIESSVKEMAPSDAAGSVESSVKEMASDAAGSVESSVKEMASDAAGSIESSVKEMAPSDAASSIESSVKEMAPSDAASSIESSAEEMTPSAAESVIAEELAPAAEPLVEARPAADPNAELPGPSFAEEEEEYMLIGDSLSLSPVGHAAALAASQAPAGVGAPKSAAQPHSHGILSESIGRNFPGAHERDPVRSISLKEPDSQFESIGQNFPGAHKRDPVGSISLKEPDSQSSFADHSIKGGEAFEDSRKEYTEALRKVLPAASVGAGVATLSSLSGFDGAFQMVGFLAATSFLAREFMWAGPRQQLLEDIGNIKDHKEFVQFLKVRKIIPEKWNQPYK